jgi:integrase/recombinase XerD
VTPAKEDEMSKSNSGPWPDTAEGLGVHLTVFVAKLAAFGYSEKTQKDKRRLIKPFIRWVIEEGISVEDIDEECVDTFLECPSRCRYMHRTALQQFVEHLRAAKVVPQRRICSSPAMVLCQRYVDHLRDQQGLSEHSINCYSPFVRTFISAQQLPENVSAVDAVAVRNHLLYHSRDRSASFVRLQAAAIRSFLRYCFLNDLIPADLSTAVLPIKRYQLATVPLFLSSEEIERVIEVADRSTTRGCRAFAILLLLARLGLRASEIITLELDDIRWETGEIVVRGKGRIYDRLPLLSDVGEALALYLSNARGLSSSRRVFLRHIAPRVGLVQPSDVSKIARQALNRASLLPAGRVGAHIFRHSLATRMIRHGATLEEISQVLRHRSIGTTRLYAKVDLEGLRGVALPWPSTEVPR